MHFRIIWQGVPRLEPCMFVRRVLTAIHHGDALYGARIDGIKTEGEASHFWLGFRQLGIGFQITA